MPPLQTRNIYRQNVDGDVPVMDKGVATLMTILQPWLVGVEGEEKGEKLSVNK